MMARVSDLMPGNKVTLLNRSAVFIARTEHPLWPHLQLVVWKMDDGTWSHDALNIDQHVGNIEPWAEPLDRRANLQRALLTPSETGTASPMRQQMKSWAQRLLNGEIQRDPTEDTADEVWKSLRVFADQYLELLEDAEQLRALIVSHDANRELGRCDGILLNH